MIRRSQVLAIRIASGVLTLLLATGTARADPCKAPLPPQGTAFSGVVRYIGDGDGFCLGPAGKPEQWIEVRLGDFYAPELHARGGAAAKRRLARLLLGKPLVCRAGRRSYDRVIGYCTLGGQPLGHLLRSGGGVQGGRGWKAAPDRPR